MLGPDLTGTPHTWLLLQHFLVKIFKILSAPAIHLHNLNVYLHVHICT